MRLKEKTLGTIEHVELTLQMQPKQENTATFCTYCVIGNKKITLLLWIHISSQVSGQAMCLENNTTTNASTVCILYGNKKKTRRPKYNIKYWNL